jgi:hypothetical protein
MNTSKEAINQTSKAFGDELREALSYTSPDLTDEGLEKHRTVLADRVRAKYRREVAAHREALYYDNRRSSFDSHRPRLDWSKPDQVAKVQSKWAAVTSKLNAGLTIGQVIETADETTLAAINEFYSDHAEANHAATLVGGQTYEQPDVTAVTRAVDDRAADLKGAHGALSTARQAEGLHAYANVTLDHLTAQLDGTRVGDTDIGVALAAEMAEATALASGSDLIARYGES